MHKLKYFIDLMTGGVYFLLADIMVTRRGRRLNASGGLEYRSQYHAAGVDHNAIVISRVEGANARQRARMR
jgi:hypothetical protein